MPLGKVQSWHAEMSAQQQRAHRQSQISQQQNNNSNRNRNNNNKNSDVSDIPPSVLESNSQTSKKLQTRLEVRRWLESIGLPSQQIFDILMQNGFETLITCK